MRPVFTHLILSGGGMASFCYFGALRFLQLEGFLDRVQHVSGSSMGAVIATGLALGIPWDVLEQRFLMVLQDPAQNCLPYPNLWTSLSSLGLDDGKRFFAVLEPEIRQETFLTLCKRTGMHLVLCATHACSMEPVYFSVDTTPHVLVQDAVRASCALPWIFQPVQIGQEYYVDGGVSDNVPFTPFGQVPPHSVLVMHTSPAHEGLKVATPHEAPWQFTWGCFSRFMTNGRGGRFLRERFPFYVAFDRCPLPLVQYTLEPEVIRLVLSKKDMDDSITYGLEKIHAFFAPRMAAADTEAELTP